MHGTRYSYQRSLQRNYLYFIFSSYLGTPNIPKELEIYTRVFDIPFPDKTEFLKIISHTCEYLWILII